MLRLLKLELGKIFKPVITTTAILTVLTCILTCVLQRDYTVYFHIDAWEIGTEYIALLFPLFVTIAVLINPSPGSGHTPSRKLQKFLA